MHRNKLIEAICVEPFQHEFSAIIEGESYLIERPREGEVLTEVFTLDGKKLCFAYHRRFQLKERLS